MKRSLKIVVLKEESWALEKEYPKFNKWVHESKNGTLRYECFPKGINPNEMYMTEEGVMTYWNGSVVNAF